MKRILLATLALAVMFTAQSEAPESVTLKNGTVYMGHTSVKNIAKAQTSFMTDSAIIVVSGENVDYSHNERNLNDLNLRWKAWFAAHPEYVHKRNDGSKFVNLYHINLKSGDVSDVLLLEFGYKYAKYIDMTQRTVVVPDSAVERYNFAPRGNLDISGVVDILYTTDGRTYEGQIVSESPQGLGILTDDLLKVIVPWNKLRRSAKQPLFKNQKFDEQIEFFDNIATKGSTKGRTGIITGIYYKPDEKEKPYYVVREAGGVNEFKIPFAEVEEIRLEKNEGYKPLTDIYIESADDILANEVKLTKAKLQETKIGSGSFVIPADTLPVSINVGDNNELKVQMKQEAESFGSIYLIPLGDPTFLPKSKDDKKFYSFTSNDLINNARRPVRSISPYNNVTLTYSIAPGTYLIYRQSDKAVFIITIKKPA